MLKPTLWFTLYRLGELGGVWRPVEISTPRLAKMLGCSQQTASRHLIELERLGYIERRIERRSELVKITERGREALESVYYGLKMALEEGETVLPTEVVGIVFTGMGEGAYYVSRPGYVRQFVRKLGYKPYPGTLNLRLVSPPTRSFLERYRPIEIEGFQTLDRTYGSGKCYPVLIEGKYEGAIVVAERTHYGYDVIEVLSPYNLREVLGLKDGDKVRLVMRAKPW